MNKNYITLALGISATLIAVFLFVCELLSHNYLGLTFPAIVILLGTIFNLTFYHKLIDHQTV